VHQIVNGNPEPVMNLAATPGSFANEKHHLVWQDGTLINRNSSITTGDAETDELAVVESNADRLLKQQEGNLKIMRMQAALSPSRDWAL
jgi:hypothetical protein